MIKATVSSRGQITIPKAVRDRLNLKAGSEVWIDVRDETLVMKRLVKEFPDWRTMQGMVTEGDRLTKSLEAEHRAEIARDDARLHACAILGRDCHGSEA